MPIQAIGRPKGRGPTTDPGDLGWDALGMGVHFTLDNGAAGGLLGNLSAADREKYLSTFDWMQDPASEAATQDMLRGKSNQASIPGAVDWGSAPVGTTQNADGSFTYPDGTQHSSGFPAAAGGSRNMLRPATTTPTVPGATPAPGPTVPILGVPTQANNNGTTGWAKEPVNPSAAGPGQPDGSPLVGYNTATPTGTTPGTTPGTTTNHITMPNSNFDWQSYLDTYGNTGANTVLGTGAHAGVGAYGLVPGIPDPVGSARQATQGNAANLLDIEGLASGINTFNLDQLLGQYRTGLPDYDALTAQSSKNIGAGLRGVVPEDVLNQLQQGAAERGIGSGSYDDPNSDYAYLKALGLTSLGQQREAETQLTNAVRRTPTTALFDPSKMMVSPEDVQAANTAANKNAAAPDPALAAAEAERRALAGIEAGTTAGGGGGGNAITAPGGGTTNTTTGTAFSPYSGGGGGGGGLTPPGANQLGGLGGGTNLTLPSDWSAGYDTGNQFDYSALFPQDGEVTVPNAGNNWNPATDPGSQFDFSSLFNGDSTGFDEYGLEIYD